MAYPDSPDAARRDVVAALLQNVCRDDVSPLRVRERHPDGRALDSLWRAVFQVRHAGSRRGKEGFFAALLVLAEDLVVGLAATGLSLVEEACAAVGESSTGRASDGEKDTHRITAVVEAGPGSVSSGRKARSLRPQAGFQQLFRSCMRVGNARWAGRFTRAARPDVPHGGSNQDGNPHVGQDVEPERELANENDRGRA